MTKHLQKFTAVLLAVIMTLGVFAVVPFTASAATSGGFEYWDLDDGTAEITGYTGTDTELTIPSEIDGYRVTSILGACDSLTSVTIPDSVTSIGNGAFRYCKSLTSITVNSNNLNYSSADGVLFNKDKTEIICYPAGKHDTSYSIPNSVTSIGNGAFRYCKSLTSITVNSNNLNYSSADGVLFNKDKTEIICYPAGKHDTSYSIPNSVTSIGNEAFADCYSLTSITIPDSVTSIGNCAFEGCTSLTNIAIPDNVTSIGSYVFSGCSSLANIPFPDSFTFISVYAFAGCTSLKSITIPDCVTSIGGYAFYGCTSLTSITIPDSVTSIGNSAFADCYSLSSVTIPDSVTSIGPWAFAFLGEKNDNFTIYGYKGTVAEKYANENGFKFIALDDSNNPNPDNTSKPSLGDIDGDGKISVNDVTDIQKYIVQLKPFTDEQMKFADVDKNGKIDVNDVTLLQKVIVKIAVI